MIGGSGKGLDAEAVRELIADGVPLAVVFDEASGNDAFRGHLVVDAFGTKAGTRVTVAQSPHVKEFRSLRKAMADDGDTPALRKGDVVAFRSAYVRGGTAYVDQVSARTHDGLSGPVQVLTAMARPSAARVSKKGASQKLTVADGKSALIARSYQEIEAFFAESRKREWPGGAAGLIVRDRDGGVAEFFEDKDTRIGHLVEELKDARALEASGGLEIIPAWTLPMGRDQVTRDVDPRVETVKPVTGPFSSRFQTGPYRELGFLPCLVVACDEDEWAFGGKTGKRIRVAHGVQPVFRREAVATKLLPTAIRAYKGMANGVLTMYGAEELAREAARRRPAAPAAGSAADSGPAVSGNAAGMAARLAAARAAPPPAPGR